MAGTTLTALLPSCTDAAVELVVYWFACSCSEFDLEMADVFKLDAIDLVDRAEARMQVTDSVAGEVMLGWG